MITSCRAARWITCGAIGACALVARAETLQNNGPLSTGATANRGTAAPAGTTWSEVQNNTGNNTESNTLAGTSAVVGSFRLADNFSVPAGERWTVTSVLQFAYRTGAPATPSPFTGGPATLRIWRGRPGDVGSVVVFGDTTSNRLSASVDNLMFRIFNSSVPPPGTAPGTTRRIWRNTLDVNPPLTLGPGEYWVDFDLIGANFVPSVTLRGNRGDMPAQGWNARQFSVATGAWSDVIDAGNPATAPDVPQDVPFQVEGTRETNLQLGACCLTDGSCNGVLTSSECAGQGGAYQGDNSTCARCVGACCVADGSCSIVAELICMQSGGTWNGAETNCGSVTYTAQNSPAVFEDILPMGIPVSLDSGNADDGSGLVSIGFNFNFYGNTQTVVRVSTNGYLVFTSTPTDGNAAGNAPIPSLSAPNSLIAPLWDDLDTGGSAPPVSVTDGVAPNRRFIVQWTAVPIFAIPGTGNTFQVILYESSNRIEFRYGVVDASPPLEATRGVEDGTGSTGTSLAGAAQSNTAFFLDPSGATCAQPAGACCFLNGSCASVTALACHQGRGIWRGAGETCAQANCEPAGACCDGNGSCQIITQTACGNSGGIYRGNETVCSPNPCAGACCASDAGCQVVTEAACQQSGGTYRGNGTNCAPNLCGGACCLGNGDCGFTTPALCALAGGRYQGDGVPCGGNSCVGSCCLSGGGCQIGSSDSCTQAGGSYSGDATNCGTYNITASPNTFEDIRPNGLLLIAAPVPLPDFGSLDDGSTQLNLPFPFVFFGLPQPLVRVSTNGYLVFTNTPGDGSVFTNVAIPNPAVPNNIICPVWDDYNLAGGGTVHVATDGPVGQRRVIIQWSDCPLFSGATPPHNTFQVLLYETSNLIEFRYGNMNAEPPRSATIGVEDGAGTLGVSIPGNSIGTGNTARFVVPTGGCSSTVTGACCNGAGCQPLTLVECQVAGGEYRGDGTTCSPSPCAPQTVLCLPYDMNADRRVDGDDISEVINVLQTGPGHPQFCYVDANTNGLDDLEDYFRFVRLLLNWIDNDILAIADYKPVSLDCNVSIRTVVLSCYTGEGDATLDVAVRNTGNEFDCPVFFQKRTCDGIDIGMPTSVAPGATLCADNVANNEELVVWCATTPGLNCKIEVKYLDPSTCP